jgi:hypothetical protein
MASTKLPATRSAITSALEASEDLAGVTIANGGGEPTRDTEYIWLFRARSTRTFVSLTGPEPRLDEEMKLSLRIVAIGGKGSAASEARATELLEAAEAALREDDSLNETVFFSHIEELECEPLLFDTTNGYAYTAVVQAKARI